MLSDSTSRPSVGGEDALAITFTVKATSTATADGDTS